MYPINIRQVSIVVFLTVICIIKVCPYILKVKNLSILLSKFNKRMCK